MVERPLDLFGLTVDGDGVDERQQEPDGVGCRVLHRVIISGGGGGGRNGGAQEKQVFREGRTD